MSRRYCHVRRSSHPTVSFSDWEILCTYVRVTLYIIVPYVYMPRMYIRTCVRAHARAGSCARARQFRQMFCQDSLTTRGVRARVGARAGYSLLSSGTHVPCVCASMLILLLKVTLILSLLACWGLPH